MAREGILRILLGEGFLVVSRIAGNQHYLDLSNSLVQSELTFHLVEFQENMLWHSAAKLEAPP